MLQGKPIGERLYEVIAIATPEVDVESAVVQLFDGPGILKVQGGEWRSGALPAHRIQRVRMVVELEGSGADLYASARVRVGSNTLSRVAMLSLGTGAPKKPQKVTVIQTPEGEVIEEVVP